MGKDKIYKLSFNDDKSVNIDLKYDGDLLNFSSENPIDCISYIENIDDKKVYWIDGENQTRKINVNSDYSLNHDDQFDSIRKINLINPNIQKISGAGFFHQVLFNIYFHL